MDLVLASASPRRQELLRKLGATFRVEASEISEEPGPGDPTLAARRLAHQKAAKVAEHNPNSVVLGADTIVVLGHAVLGKPRDAMDAMRMLHALSGKTHQVITGVCAVSSQVTLRGSETTFVRFRVIEPQEIEEYCATGEPFDKAGAYGIQAEAARFVERVDGCYNNVVGLPVDRVARMLQFLGVATTF